jgi:hypothetical protein
MPLMMRNFSNINSRDNCWGVVGTWCAHDSPFLILKSSLKSTAPLDRRPQVVSQNAEEKVRLDAMFEVMKNGPLRQRTLHRPEGRLDARQQDVGAPDFIGGQVDASERRSCFRRSRGCDPRI